MGKNDGKDQTSNKSMWICEEETGDMGNVNQLGGQSKVHAKVSAV